MECKYCSTKINENTYFCPKCGKMMGEQNVQNSEIIAEYEKKMLEVINQVQNTQHVNVAWNVTVDKYNNVINKMQTLMTAPEFGFDKENSIVKRMELFKNRCLSPEFHIAFVGTIKAGKSTLINALLGKNYASTSVTPETAVLTKFRHSDKENYLNVKFYSKDEWDMLWNSISGNADVFLEEYKSLNGEQEKNKWIGHDDEHIVVTDDSTLEKEIEHWTSSKKAEHYFVKEVEIGLMEFKMPEKVVFVDTPGLDDAVKYRSDVTRQYIDRANAVFVCVKADTLTGPELNTLYRIFANTSYNPEKVYVIGTQWDAVLNNPTEDWKKQKEEWTKYLSRKDAYGSVELARRNITYAAAYVNNLARDYAKLNEDEQWIMSSIAFKFRIKPTELESNLAKLVDMSNVAEIERHIQQDLVPKYEEYLYKDIEESYFDIKKELKQYFGEVKDNEQKIIDASDKDIEGIREEYNKAQDELEKIQKYRKQLADTLKLVQEDTKNRISELTKQLKGLV